MQKALILLLRIQMDYLAFCHGFGGRSNKKVAFDKSVIIWQVLSELLFYAKSTNSNFLVSKIDFSWISDPGSSEACKMKMLHKTKISYFGKVFKSCLMQKAQIPTFIWQT